MTVRVLIVDDEPLVRAGIRGIIETDTSIDVVGEAGDGESCLHHVTALHPDVVLLDVRMPQLDGLTTAERIAESHPTTRVVVVTTFDDERAVARAVAAGVSGFLLKSGDPHDLVRGVHAAVDGGAVLTPRVASRLLSTLKHPTRRPELNLDNLTPREREILTELAHGLSNGEIAAKLHLTEGTVKGYVSQVLQRLGVRNRVEAALLAWERGLVS